MFPNSVNSTPAHSPHSSARRLSTTSSFIFGSSRPLIDKHYAINDKYLDPDASMRLRYQVASIFIDDAINKRRTETRVINTKAGEAETALRAFFIVHNSWWRRFIWLCIIVQLSLAFFERPSFHATQHLNERYIAIVELFCVLVFIADMIARMLTLGYENYLKSLWNVIKLFVVLAMLLDIGIILMIPQSLHFTRILRSYILLEKSRTVRNVTWNILRSIPKMFPVFGMMLALILFYAILATIMFVNENDPDYSNLLESTVSMFILTTTENFPDVMLPEYKQSAWNSLFFISFLLISQLFFVNLVVAVFYQTYQEHVIQNIRQDLVFRKESLTKAFELIKNSENAVDFESFRNVFFYLKYNFSEHNVQFIYHMLDKDHDQSLNLTEFLFLCDVMKFTFEEIDEVVEQDTETLTYKVRYFLEAITSSRVWKGFVDLVIVMSTIEVIAEVHKCHGKCSELMWVEYMLGFFFIAEVGIRIFALGTTEFFRKQWNRFDFLLCLLSLAWLSIVRPSFDSSAPSETLLIIRVLFCLRVMGTTKKLDIFVSTILQLIPAMTCFVTVLLSIFYLYAILGMELFWNVITKDNPVYGDSNPDYYLINFNNMHYALVTLYVLMTVNNWNTFMAGTVAATSKWARLYFISFYLLTVLIVLNVIIAFVIETFVEAQQALTTTSPGTLPSNINGAITDEEIQERIHIAAKRATRAVRMKVQPKRDLNAIHEGLLKESLDSGP